MPPKDIEYGSPLENPQVREQLADLDFKKVAFLMIQPAIQAWLFEELTTGNARQLKEKLKLEDYQLLGLAEYLSKKVVKILD